MDWGNQSSSTLERRVDLGVKLERTDMWMICMHVIGGHLNEWADLSEAWAQEQSYSFLSINTPEGHLSLTDLIKSGSWQALLIYLQGGISCSLLIHLCSHVHSLLPLSLVLYHPLSKHTQKHSMTQIPCPWILKGPMKAMRFYMSPMVIAANAVLESSHS